MLAVSTSNREDANTHDNLLSFYGRLSLFPLLPFRRITPYSDSQIPGGVKTWVLGVSKIVNEPRKIIN